MVIAHKHIKELETLVLRMVRPKGNKQLGRFVKSENLRSRLSRDLRRKQREELTQLLGKRRRVTPAKTSLRRPNRDVSPGALTPYISRGFRIRARYKRKTIRARVLQNGWIRYGDYLYKTPSGAGRAARKRSTNGWTFWEYVRSPGEWVPLRELRK